ncbi:MAG: UDP-N-acetylmuramoylalanyl-D-glutamyl-2,6-diaminopimelate--D-alanyl-D-alanine ligase [Polyangiaceae bacterium]|jgi:UDP-N-acetylmuramoyl-tripeptide--D-alanyl-D-alanine ligase|nr:UDP-N-acetylmuramoylalanyl-D-glutamyl-2,6-diaminopimelate--D-alanyl-D-alanine ligase [Polyangiaceae bacterium]
MAGAALPTNQVELSLGDVMRATGGVLVGDPSLQVRGVCTDSRADLRGALFVALVGERFDAHAFVEQARERGAAALLVEREVASSLPTVRVPSTLAALGALGALRRRNWGGKVVAVAGSAGKTTTRAALSALLEAAEPGLVHYARGNFNNLIGVPLVLLSLSERERLAVVELGTNQPGEVATLTRMAAPDVGVLTLIGYEHTEGLGDLDGVEEEEASLFAGVSVAVGNVDDERVARQLARVTSPKVSYGKHATADYRFRVLGLSARGSELAVTRLLAGREVTTSFRTSTLGDAGAYAACAALAAAETLLGRELSADTLTTAFASSVASEAGRLCPIELDDGTLVLDDTYNANPESVLSSVSLARQLAEQRAVPLLLVLGEMRELGALSATLHRQVGEAVAAQRPALLISVAGDARLFADVAAARGIVSEFAEDSEAGAELLLTRLRGPAVILVKASRGVRAEKVVSRLISAKGRAA